MKPTNCPALNLTVNFLWSLSLVTFMDHGSVTFLGVFFGHFRYVQRSTDLLVKRTLAPELFAQKTLLFLIRPFVSRRMIKWQEWLLFLILSFLQRMIKWQEWLYFLILLCLKKWESGQGWPSFPIILSQTNGSECFSKHETVNFSTLGPTWNRLGWVQRLGERLESWIIFGQRQRINGLLWKSYPKVC